jgi:hypothetical protein
LSQYNYFQKSRTPQKKVIHPIWYGIGCLLTILTPIISWAASMVLLDYGLTQKWSFLGQLSAKIQFPAIFYQTPQIKVAAIYLSGIPYLEAIALFFVMFMIFFSGIFALINAFLYRTFGPPRYSAIDAPPPSGKVKRSR